MLTVKERDELLIQVRSDLLLDNHCLKINLKKFDDDDFTFVTTQLTPTYCDIVENIDLSCTEISDKSKELFRFFQNAKDVKLSQTKVTGETLVYFTQRLTDLESLNLKYSKVTTIPALNECFLKKLVLQGNQLVGDTVANLNTLVYLEELDLSRTRISESMLLGLTGLFSLEFLVVDWPLETKKSTLLETIRIRRDAAKAEVASDWIEHPSSSFGLPQSFFPPFDINGLRLSPPLNMSSSPSPEPVLT